ncbi:MAG: hypothetical protein KDE22_02415, partial [Rhodobacterales bacterium]|nr:hypothetical protein [Rhodobacterales bacterium]
LSVLACGLLWLAAGAAPAAEPAPRFQTMLDEARAAFAAPEAYVETAPPAVEGFAFDRALAAPDGALVAAYAVRPIARMEIDYNDPHSSAPNPNHIFPLVYEALVGRLSGGGATPSRDFPPQDAQQRFNADWASATAFDVDPAVSRDYRQGFLLALHKNGLADTYTLFLYNDPATAKTRINTLLTSLMFR